MIKITYLDVTNMWHAATVHNTQWVLFIKHKIQDLLIINRHGLISWQNGWCYHMCQKCIQQDCSGNRISTRREILQIWAHGLSTDIQYCTCSVTVLESNLTELSPVPSFWLSHFQSDKKHGLELKCRVKKNTTCKPLCLYAYYSGKYLQIHDTRLSKKKK